MLRLSTLRLWSASTVAVVATAGLAGYQLSAQCEPPPGQSPSTGSYSSFEDWLCRNGVDVKGIQFKDTKVIVLL
jgi:hypothetical protein